MTTLRSLVPHPPIAALAFALTATAAHAVTLNTPVVGPTFGGEFVCSVSNVGTKVAKLTVTLYNQDGGVYAPSADDCVSTFAGELPAGKTCSVTKGLPGGGTGGGFLARCTVVSSYGKVRAVLGNDGAGLTAQAATK